MNGKTIYPDGDYIVVEPDADVAGAPVYEALYIPNFDVLRNDVGFMAVNSVPLLPEYYTFNSVQNVLDFYIQHGIISQDDLTK